MKRHVVLLATFFISFCVAAQYGSPRKIALLIAIGDYPPESGWQKINSTNDLDLVHEVLLRQGFEESNIHVVRDGEATRDGILRSVRTHFLNRAQPGDVLFFQFSGHGQQVADDDGDELDGFDEAIVPINSPMRFGQGGYRGENLIRDEELGSLFREARQRIGSQGNLLVLLDACHSGTGTRGMGCARGTDHVMADSNYVAAHRGAGTENSTTQSENLPNLAPMAAFFGASANQLNFETRDEAGRPVGSLTYAFCKKIAQSDYETTYRGLFDQIRAEMSNIAPRQQPQAEGTLDQQIFGGSLVQTPRYIRVVRWNDPQSVGIEAGWMHGLNEGTVVGLYPPETRDPAQAAAFSRGTIRRCTPFESTVSLETAVRQEEAGTAWVYILEKNFGDLKANISIRVDEGHPIARALRSRLASIPVIREDDNAPDLFLIPSGNGVQLTTASNFLLTEIGSNMTPSVAAERVVREIISWAQASYMRDLQTVNPELKLEMEIIPVELDTRTLQVKRTMTLRDKTDGYGNVRFREGDHFKIKVHNRGDKAAYFNLLDIQPDNKVNVMVPDDGETPAEFRVAPGQTMEIPRSFEIVPPRGAELFKLIATDKPVDLRPISQSRGAGVQQKGTQNPLERLFGQTYFNDDVITRGGKTVGVAAGSMHVQSVSFIIE